MPKILKPLLISATIAPILSGCLFDTIDKTVDIVLGSPYETKSPQETRERERGYRFVNGYIVPLNYDDRYQAVTTSVTSFYDENTIKISNLKNKSILIFEPKEKKGDLEFKHYKNLVSKMLLKDGITVSKNLKSADYVAFLIYGISKNPIRTQDGSLHYKRYATIEIVTNKGKDKESVIEINANSKGTSSQFQQVGSCIFRSMMLAPLKNGTTQYVAINTHLCNE